MNEREILPVLPTRRGLMCGAAAAGAVGLIGPLAGVAQAATAMSGEVLTGSHWGGFYATLAGGKITGFKPWEKDPHPSAQLPGVIDSIHSPSRILHPMVRRAWLEKGPGAAPEERGNGDFVRVSWDKALDLVHQELDRVSKKYGSGGVFAGSYGWKSTGKLHNCRTLLYRMMKARGQNFVNGIGDYSTGASQVIMPHVVGTIEVYDQQTVWPVVIDNTKLMVFWGADPLKNSDISWTIADHGAYPWIAKLKEKGVKTISIDPYHTRTCKYLGSEWIKVRPQTDVPLMLGIAHTLVTEKLHDEKFLQTYTVGFDKFLPYLMGETDKTPKSAEWAASLCGIAPDVIRGLARSFAANRTMLASGWAIQRMHHGEQAHWMLVTLAAMLGQIGLPGGGFGLSYHYSSGGTPTADAAVLPGMSDGTVTKGQPWMSAAGAAAIPVARIVDMLENPGKDFDFNGKTYKYPDPKLIYWVGGDPFAHHQQRNRQVAAWNKRIETFIVHDFQWTATARHADIVLPSTSAYERNDMDMVGDYSHQAILAMKQVIPPVAEARNDFDIFAAICARAGADKEKAFTEGKSEMQWLKGFYDVALKQAQAKKIPMPDFDTFWKKGWVEFAETKAGNSYVRYKAFRDDPLLNALGTPSGKIEIYSQTIEKMHYDDCPPHPTWMEPIERAGAPGAKFPLHISSNHPPARLHSQLCGTSLRQTYDVAGREPCLINPADAKKRGIANGDLVRVFNDRGQILAGAVVTEDTMEGTIVVHEGGWYDPANPGKPDTLDRYGDVNVLTPDIGTSKLAQGNCGHTCIGDVEKFVGMAPAVDVFTAPKQAA